jgi:hypothetical protein
MFGRQCGATYLCDRFLNGMCGYIFFVFALVDFLGVFFEKDLEGQGWNVYLCSPLRKKGNAL